MDTEENKTEDQPVVEASLPYTGTEVTAQSQQEVVSQTTDEPSLLAAQPMSDIPPKTGFKAKLHACKAAYVRHKKISIPATIIALLLVLLAIPVTRYQLLGLVIKKDYSVTVLDSKTNKPISSVDVSLGGKTAKTDQSGKATVSHFG